MSSVQSSSEMAAEVGLSTRKSRGERRRPDAAPPPVERIPPRSGLSRAEVIAVQRRRILAGLAQALAYHGYEDTKITDIVELAGVSRPTFYEHFEGKEQCFAAAYADGVERLAATVAAAGEEGEGAVRLSAGLRAGLEFLAADPPLAHLLLVESLAAARPARLEHERTLARLARTIQIAAGSEPSEQTALLLAGGLSSYLSGRILAGGAERLAEAHDTLLDYLVAASLPAAGADERRTASG
jgi:AcrR family transcriptional regulator